MSSTVACAGDPFPGSAFPSPLYRIPALCVTGTGRIIVAFDVREDWRDLPADFDLAMRVSDDDGATWSPPRALRAHTPGHGFGDASLTYDPQRGTVLCWYVGSRGESYFSATAGGPGLELWLARSQDDGATWTHTDMSHLRPAHVAGMFTSSGNGTVTPDGVIVQPFVARIGEENWAILARSEDGGESWEMSEPIGPDCDENKVLALPNGSLLMHARSRPQRRQARAASAQEAMSEPLPVPALRDPACNGGLCWCDGVVVASMCDDPEDRTALSIHVSTDLGESFSPAMLVDDGAAAYSVLADMGRGRVLLVWEADNYRTLRARIITLAELGVVEREGAPCWDAAHVSLQARRCEPGQERVAKPPVVNPAS